MTFTLKIGNPACVVQIVYACKSIEIEPMAQALDSCGMSIMGCHQLVVLAAGESGVLCNVCIVLLNVRCSYLIWLPWNG